MNKWQKLWRSLGLITTILLINCHPVKAADEQKKIGGIPTLCHLKVLPVGNEGLGSKVELFKQYIAIDNLESAGLIYQSISNPEFKLFFGKELIDRYLNKKQPDQALPIINDLANIQLKDSKGEQKVQDTNQLATYYIKAGDSQKAIALLQTSINTLKTAPKITDSKKILYLIDYAQNYLLLKDNRSAIAYLDQANSLLNKSIVSKKNKNQFDNISIQTEQIVPLYQEAGSNKKANDILNTLIKKRFNNNSDRVRALGLVTKSAVKIGNQTLADASFNQALKIINSNQSNDQKLAQLKTLQSLWKEPTEKIYLDKTIEQFQKLTNTPNVKINQDATNQIITSYLANKDFDNALNIAKSIKDPFKRGMAIDEVTKNKLLIYSNETNPLNITPEFINFVKEQAPEMEKILGQISRPEEKQEFIPTLINYYLFSEQSKKAIDLINTIADQKNQQQLKLNAIFTLLLFGDTKKAKELITTVNYKEEELAQAIFLISWINPTSINQDLVEIAQTIKDENIRKGILLKIAEVYVKANKIEEGLAILPITEKDENYGEIMKIIAIKYAEVGEMEKAMNISKKITSSTDKKFVDDLLACSQKVGVK